MLNNIQDNTTTGAREKRLSKLKFNHPALRDILREIECEFIDNFDNLIMRCFMDTTCFEHRKPSLYLKCSGELAGVWKCFRCNRRGFVDELVRAWTGWNVWTAGRYLQKHQAYDDPDDEVVRMYEPAVKSDLAQYCYRHEYCYKRRLDEETCLRYQLGFDQSCWMITFPIFAADGKLAAIKKRSVNSRMFQYLPTEEHRMTLFGIHLVKPQSILWICEGEFDAMFVDQVLRDYGFANQGAVAIGGKDLSDRVLPELQVKAPIYFVDALDNDKEGREASKSLRAKLSVIAPSMRLTYETEQTKDPNESSIKHLMKQAKRAQALAKGSDNG